MILTPDDIEALTGRTQHSAQRRVLDALGIASRTRPDGSLVVLRAVAEEMLGLVNNARVKQISGPIWSEVR